MKFKIIVQTVLFSVLVCLIAFGTAKEQYSLLLLSLVPVFTLGVIALILEKPYVTAKSTEIVELPHHIRSKMNIRLVSIMIVGVIGLNFIAQGNPSLFERILASVIIILGVLPTFLYIKRDESGIPFLPLFGVIYSVYYGLPIFTLENYSINHISLSHSSVEKALLLALIGLLMLYLAYYKFPGMTISKHVPKVSIYWNTQKAKLWAVLFIIVGLGTVYFNLTTHVPVRFEQVILALKNLSMLGIGILFILQIQGHLNNAGKAMLWGIALPSLVILKLGTGAIAQILFIMIFLSLTFWTFRRKIPWKVAVYGMLILIFLLNVRAEFRELTWEGGSYRHKNPIEKSLMFVKMAETGSASLSLGVKIVKMRLAHMLPFAHVIHQTPDNIPFWNGRSYETLIWKPIPRILYPDKPVKIMGQEFGHRYDFLSPTDYSTSFNFPQLIEMYANFGIIGVILGMYAIGVIYRFLMEMFCHRKAGEGGLMIGLMLFTGLSNIESNFSLVFGGLFYHALLLILVNLLIKVRPVRH